VNTNLTYAHRKSYRLIKSISPALWVGTAENNVFFEAAGLNPWNQALKLLYDFFWNRRFLNRVRDCCDFIGINYYSHNRIDWRSNRNENKMISDMGSELYPEGLYHVLKNAARRYQKPVFVTENGLADVKDDKRAAFIRTHIAATARAKNEGADIRGYFYWSLLDNFEWDKGFWPRFGLVEVDYKTVERRVRPSAWEYKKIIERGL
jgi:beta-glucosidase